MNCDTSGSAAHVAEQVRAGNPWYVGSQFEWAEQPAVRPIYEMRDRFFRACLSRLSGQTGEKIRFLDAGCGDGYWLHRLADVPGLDMTGIDYNPTRIERARQVAPRARVLAGDLEVLEHDAPFDVILLSQVIEHVANDTGLLRRIRSLLRDGGTLILGAPNEGCMLQTFNRRLLGKRFTTDHVHFYTEAELREKVLKTGFRIGQVLREPFFPGHDRLFTALMSRGWGRWILTMLVKLIPSQASDYYFECRASGNT